MLAVLTRSCDTSHSQPPVRATIIAVTGGVYACCIALGPSSSDQPDPKIGDKTLTEVLELRQNGSGTEFGAAQCDACHTRHTFSVEEARSPQA